MRSLRLLLAAVVLGLGVGVPAVAQAAPPKPICVKMVWGRCLSYGQPQPQSVAKAYVSPSNYVAPGPAEVQQVRGVAIQDWVQRVGVAGPWCGTPQIHFIHDDGTSIGHPGNWAGLTYYNLADPCGITIKAQFVFDPAVFCQVYEHEVGHLILGAYNGAANPNDPWHSTNPYDIMQPYAMSINMPPRCHALNPTSSYPPGDFHSVRKQMVSHYRFSFDGS